MRFSALYLLLFSGGILADGTVPAMKMHVFEAVQTDAVVAEPVEPGMKMHVFADEPVQLTEQAVEPRRKEESGFDMGVKMDTGYQHDTLSWSVAAPMGTPDTLTETRWRQNMWGLNGEVLLSSPWDVVFKASGGYAWAYDGSGNETSYLHDGHNNAFSSVNSDVDGSTAWEASVALGYAFKFAQYDPVAQFNLTPLAGYMWQEQSLQLGNGVQTTPVQMPLGSALTNRYIASWEGAWIGFDTDVVLFERHQIFSSFSYHWADYRAEGQWQQNSALQQPTSFKHWADANGFLTSIGYRYMASEFWSAHLVFDYQNWDSAKGEEELYLSSGTLLRSQLNGVKRESFAVNMGVRLAF
ncbi:MAG: hypothetical protein GQ583_07805 [Methyloprofundus sp.]|nr:hypothetical protein [Methyloprofundus sp.]